MCLKVLRDGVSRGLAFLFLLVTACSGPKPSAPANSNGSNPIFDQAASITADPNLSSTIAENAAAFSLSYGSAVRWVNGAGNFLGILLLPDSAPGSKMARIVAMESSPNYSMIIIPASAPGATEWDTKLSSEFPDWAAGKPIAAPGSLQGEGASASDPSVVVVTRLTVPGTNLVGPPLMPTIAPTPTVDPAGPPMGPPSPPVPSPPAASPIATPTFTPPAAPPAGPPTPPVVSPPAGPPLPSPTPIPAPGEVRISFERNGMLDLESIFFPGEMMGVKIEMTQESNFWMPMAPHCRVVFLNVAMDAWLTQSSYSSNNTIWMGSAPLYIPQKNYGSSESVHVTCRDAYDREISSEGSVQIAPVFAPTLQFTRPPTLGTNGSFLTGTGSLEVMFSNVIGSLLPSLRCEATVGGIAQPIVLNQVTPMYGSSPLTSLFQTFPITFSGTPGTVPVAMACHYVMADGEEAGEATQSQQVNYNPPLNPGTLGQCPANTDKLINDPEIPNRPELLTSPLAKCLWEVRDCAYCVSLYSNECFHRYEQRQGGLTPPGEIAESDPYWVTVADYQIHSCMPPKIPVGQSGFCQCELPPDLPGAWNLTIGAAAPDLIHYRDGSNISHVVITLRHDGGNASGKQLRLWFHTGNLEYNKHYTIKIDGVAQNSVPASITPKVQPGDNGTAITTIDVIAATKLSPVDQLAGNLEFSAALDETSAPLPASWVRLESDLPAPEPPGCNGAEIKPAYGTVYYEGPQNKASYELTLTGCSPFYPPPNLQISGFTTLTYGTDYEIRVAGQAIAGLNRDAPIAATATAGTIRIPIEVIPNARSAQKAETARWNVSTSPNPIWPAGAFPMSPPSQSFQTDFRSGHAHGACLAEPSDSSDLVLPGKAEREFTVTVTGKPQDFPSGAIMLAMYGDIDLFRADGVPLVLGPDPSPIKLDPKDPTKLYYRKVAYLYPSPAEFDPPANEIKLKLKYYGKSGGAPDPNNPNNTFQGKDTAGVTLLTQPDWNVSCGTNFRLWAEPHPTDLPGDAGMLRVCFEAQPQLTYSWGPAEAEIPDPLPGGPGVPIPAPPFNPPPPSTIPIGAAMFQIKYEASAVKDPTYAEYIYFGHRQGECQELDPVTGAPGKLVVIAFGTDWTIDTVAVDPVDPLSLMGLLTITQKGQRGSINLRGHLTQAFVDGNKNKRYVCSAHITSNSQNTAWAWTPGSVCNNPTTFETIQLTPPPQIF